MDSAEKFSGELIFQLEFREAASGTFFWRYRTADGWVAAEASRLFPELDLCVANACEEGVRAFMNADSGPQDDRTAH